MAVEISVRYTGDLHCNAEHGPSKTEIATDAPADNKGKGEAFSPTDLVATALATACGFRDAVHIGQAELPWLVDRPDALRPSALSRLAHLKV